MSDTSGDIARGFIRDTLPLRVLGEIPFFLESVEDVNAFTQEVTVYKGGISHEIDLGDVLRFIGDSSGVPVGSGEVVVDPSDDLDNPGAQPRARAYPPRRRPGRPRSAQSPRLPRRSRRARTLGWCRTRREPSAWRSSPPVMLTAVTTRATSSTSRLPR